MSTIPSNRRFLEITWEIIRKSEAPAVGHHSRHGLGSIYWHIYILVHDFRMGLHSSRTALVCDSIRPSSMDLQAGCCALCARNFFSFLFFFFFAYYGLFGAATCGVSVWNGGLTESTASVHYLHRVLDSEEM